jgi:tetratricopeptide (TPR) repeat protein
MFSRRHLPRRRAAAAAISLVPVALAAGCARPAAPDPAPVPAPAAAPAAATPTPPPAPIAQATRPTPRADSLRAASRLDLEGRTAEARQLFAALVASAPDAAARAAAQRATAMSYAFDGDCANAVQAEQQVMAYWQSREAAEPQNAFYQQGEMANEAARVCIDAGQLDEAERLYRLGRTLGLREPEPRTHPASLWEFRTAHALARLAARRGRADEARRHVAEARRILDADTAMARGQRRFLPYLEGYVALYTGDLAAAERHLQAAVAAPGNQNDPFLPYLLGEVYERQGRAAEARAAYQTAFDKATAHNPPAAFTRPAARRKLAAR